MASITNIDKMNENKSSNDKEGSNLSKKILSLIQKD